MEFGSVATPVSTEIENETVDRAREGDQQALADIYDWYLPRVYRYVLARVGNVAEAEDLTEDIFLRMLGAIGDYRRRNVPFSAWLFRIAHNHVVSYFRRNGLRSNRGILHEGIIDERPGPAYTVERQLMVEEVVRATQDLPEAQREVIALRFAVGLSVAETAQVLGKRQGNVKALQHKAVVKLQQVLAAKPGRLAAEV